ncbi:MAG: Lrp/AsnC family transcriptional regulator [Rhodocyclaceae bacterium]|jgi:DNA-binding Lrp family transcriptional regulator|nr:Lrp/AsnC family transcriptional regulator [Rhodocyclaceae bacterium]
MGAILAAPDLTPASLDYALLNDFQRDLPLVPRPYEVLAHRLGCPEATVVTRLSALQAGGSVSRVGVVFAPRRVGASTLAALAVPPDRLDEVAKLVNAHPGVNHNYEREHTWNLWFVATAPDQAALTAALAVIRRESACPLLVLPLATEYHIDLGFDLGNGRRALAAQTQPEGPPQRVLNDEEQRLVVAIQDGLPLESRPFAALGQAAGLTESRVLALLAAWLEEGIAKRCGVVVRHHELGFRANAMGVWAIPEERADALGQRLAREEGINLCYRRQPAPGWPYNLYCMVHGRDRLVVENRIHQLNQELGLDVYPSAVLFSLRRFKQRGACYGRVAP